MKMVYVLTIVKGVKGEVVRGSKSESWGVEGGEGLESGEGWKGVTEVNLMKVVKLLLESDCVLHSITKGGRSASKFRKSHIRKFA